MDDDGIDILVDLSGAITVVLPPNEQGERIEIESIGPADPYAPRE